MVAQYKKNIQALSKCQVDPIVDLHVEVVSRNGKYSVKENTPPTVSVCGGFSTYHAQIRWFLNRCLQQQLAQLVSDLIVKGIL